MNDYHGKTLLQVNTNPKAIPLREVRGAAAQLRATIRRGCPLATMSDAFLIPIGTGVSLGIYWEDPAQPGHIRYVSIIL